MKNNIIGFRMKNDFSFTLTDTLIRPALTGISCSEPGDREKYPKLDFLCNRSLLDVWKLLPNNNSPRNRQSNITNCITIKLCFLN